MFDIGIDIEDIARFKKYIKTDRFIELCFTNYEIEYCYAKADFAKHLAARFCAKEALIKSLPERCKNIGFIDIEVRNDTETGKPKIFCSKLKNYDFKVSLSHDKDKAIAVVCSINKSFYQF